jgi:hypothetical protein
VWLWGRDEPAARPDPVECGVRDAVAAYEVLAVHGFAAPEAGLRVSVVAAGASRGLLWDGRLALPAPACSAATRLAERVRRELRDGQIGSVEAAVPAGSAPGGTPLHLGVSVHPFAEYVTAQLTTHSDIWLPYDLRGRPQPEVYAANGPRLTAVLGELAEVLGSETDPDDPTHFARPTETGAENFFTADGRASDVWRSFEVPRRYEVFTHAPGFGRIGYRRTAEGEVRCLPVGSDEHGLLGHLWASDGEKAAGFEPVNVDDDIVYRAGLIWLERLRSAHERGLSPAAALEELSALPDEGGAGRVLTSKPPRTTRLDVLRKSADD